MINALKWGLFTGGMISVCFYTDPISIRFGAIGIFVSVVVFPLVKTLSWRKGRIHWLENGRWYSEEIKSNG